MSNRTQQTAPERIYLQTGCDSDTEFKELAKGEVTWCADKVEEIDLEYIRADLQQSRVIEFAEWVGRNVFTQCSKSGSWHDEYGRKLADNTEARYFCRMLELRVTSRAMSSKAARLFSSIWLIEPVKHIH